MSRSVEVDDNMVACYPGDGSIHFIKPRTFYAMLTMDSTGPKPYVRYDDGAKMFDVSRGEFIKVAHEAEAVHLHNKTAYVNVKQVCKYIESLSDGR